MVALKYPSRARVREGSDGIAKVLKAIVSPSRIANRSRICLLIIRYRSSESLKSRDFEKTTTSLAFTSSSNVLRLFLCLNGSSSSKPMKSSTTHLYCSRALAGVPDTREIPIAKPNNKPMYRSVMLLRAQAPVNQRSRMLRSSGRWEDGAASLSGAKNRENSLIAARFRWPVWGGTRPSDGLPRKAKGHPARARSQSARSGSSMRRWASAMIRSPISAVSCRMVCPFSVRQISMVR